MAAAKPLVGGPQEHVRADTAYQYDDAAGNPQIGYREELPPTEGLTPEPGTTFATVESALVFATVETADVTATVDTAEVFATTSTAVVSVKVDYDGSS